MTTEFARVSEVIGTAYDAALDPQLWPRVLDGLSEIVNCKAASIMMMDPIDHNKLSMSIDFGTDPEWTHLLHTVYAGLCPIGPIMMFAEIDEPACMWDYITEEEFRETRFYQEWCRPQDFYHFAGAVIAKTAKEVGSLSFIRGRWDPAFDKQDFSVIAILSPHIRRAVTIAGLLKHQAVELASLNSVMNQLTTAILVVDAKGRLLSANAAAEELLLREAGMRLHEGRLSLNDGTPGNGVLERALAACSGRAELVPIADGEGRSRLTAAVMPVDATRATFAVLVHNPPPTLPAMGRPLAAAFGLTPREVAVLMPLMEGKSPAEIADILGVSLATVRSHLARLFEKTHTERQADLVRVIMQAMPPIHSE
jgi:DNA-binding CsgD family transcriptional regulator/PAS domain-containing protein